MPNEGITANNQQLRQRLACLVSMSRHGKEIVGRPPPFDLIVTYKEVNSSHRTREVQFLVLAPASYRAGYY
jgi:hypothetical protein